MQIVNEFVCYLNNNLTWMDLKAYLNFQKFEMKTQNLDYKFNSRK